MPIPAHDVLGARGDGAFEDGVVVEIVGHGVDHFCRHDAAREQTELSPRLQDIGLGPAEFASQDVRQSIEDGVRDREIDRTGSRELQQLVRIAFRECEPGDEDVRIGGDADHVSGCVGRAALPRPAAGRRPPSAPSPERAGCRSR